MTNTTPPRPEQIGAACSLLGWSQQQLAEKAGVAVSTLADFERGQRSLMPNNALAIQRALEMAGVIFTATGVSYGFHWLLMAEHSTVEMIFTYKPEAIGSAIDFATIFGSPHPPKFSFNTIQCATPELKSKLFDYAKHHNEQMPQIARLLKMITDMPDGDFFLLLPRAPSSSEEQFRWERVLRQLNHPLDQPVEGYLHFFGSLLEKYDLHYPRTDKRFGIGNAKKTDRTCRFCAGTTRTGALFKNQAHAIPAALGNTHLKLYDECDVCNHFFGDEIEPDLIEVLNIPRVFLGIEARGSVPVLKFTGGTLRNEGGAMVVESEKISEDASGVLTAQLGNGKAIVPQNVYRALSKIALSVIPAEELPALTKTIDWVRYGKYSNEPLPKVAASLVKLPPNPSAQITLYIRKELHSKMPHVVCEFRLGCYIYVYALPFSDRDEGNLNGFFEEHDFKQTFRHYALQASWSQHDYSGAYKIKTIQSIRLQPSNACSGSQAF